MPKQGVSKSDYPFVTVYEPMAGWKAVKYWWNPDMGGFPEPWQTSDFAYATADEARQCAMEWAVAEEINFLDERDGKLYNAQEVKELQNG